MTEPLPPAKLARDLETQELRTVIETGVYRGAMKALGTYAILSALVWVLFLVLRSSLT